MTIRHNIINPGATIIVWNYEDRLNAEPTNPGTVNKIEQIIVNSASLISIRTSKSKSAPSGQFEISLAPTVNWTARITPGSWCAILMSQNPIDRISNRNPGFADPRTFKMLGRIDSCRTVVDVEQVTGARNTSFVVTGRDWGSVFDTKLYIDPVLRDNNLEKLSSIGHVLRILSDDLFTEYQSSKEVPSSSDVVKALIKIWGAPLIDINGAVDDALGGVNKSNRQKTSRPSLKLTSAAQFKLPKEVANYMKQGTVTEEVNFSKLIKLREGILVGPDKYSGDKVEAQGYPDPASLYGLNTFWQLLVDNSNPVMNELVTDMRWEGNNPIFALYKRAKPFVNRSPKDIQTNDQVDKNLSPFKNVRQIAIPLDNVLTINAGTNWRDKINFIELQPKTSFLQKSFEKGAQASVKLKSQVIDEAAYGREGFKPLFQNVYYFPYKGGDPAPIEAMKWNPLITEWYFNTHLMLNGSTTIIGQDQYIQVGDNIKIDSTVLGEGSFNSKQRDSSTPTFLLAHVESLQHNFFVNPETGARTFTTTINFVRGVITDAKGAVVGNNNSSLLSGALDAAKNIGGGIGGGGGSGSLDGALERSASDLPLKDEKNTNVLGTSTDLDPDNDKLKGR